MPQEGKAYVDLTVSSFTDRAAGLELAGGGGKRAKKLMEERDSFLFTHGWTEVWGSLL